MKEMETVGICRMASFNVFDLVTYVLVWEMSHDRELKEKLKQAEGHRRREPRC